MSSLTQFLTTYPALLAAVVLLFVLLAVALKPKANSSSCQFLLPAFLTEPAVYLMRFAPGRYLVWLQQRLVFAGWRNNLYFGSLCAAKIYPCLLTAFLPLFVHPGYALLALVLLFFSPDCLLAFMAKKRHVHSEIGRAHV